MLSDTAPPFHDGCCALLLAAMPRLRLNGWMEGMGCHAWTGVLFGVTGIGPAFYVCET